jgi:hypothetical protein
MRRVDAFLIADEMQFSSSGWAHRNRVRGPRGVQWLTVPTQPSRGQAIRDVAIDRAVPWARTHLETIRHFYARSPFADAVVRELDAVLDPDASRLVDVSIPILRRLAALLGIETPLLLSSALGLEARYRETFPDTPSPTHRIIAFMKAVDATDLLEGESGRSYLDVGLCAAHGIRVEFHHYEHPVYPQLHAPFVSHLSIVDLLCSVGPEEARHVLARAA